MTNSKCTTRILILRSIAILISQTVVSAQSTTDMISTTGFDFDECAVGLHNCDVNSHCINTVGSFICFCRTGYTGNRTSCEDIDECTDGSDNCDDNANCLNTDGSFDCVCKTGYSGNGTTCDDMDDCSTGSDSCDINANCVNTDGSFNCACKTGYTGNGVTCTDVDECSEGSDNCDLNADCVNTDGSFTCDCKSGYTGNGTTCEDMDECFSGSDSCDVKAHCFNTVGSFICACKTGYRGNGTTCTDLDECWTGSHNCDVNADCINTVGSFICVCTTGYTGNGITCEDINECSTGLHNCDANASCNNTLGSFICVCYTGYTGNGIKCKDMDECSGGSDNCDVNANCTNTEGSFHCLCKPGYTGNGVTCMEPSTFSATPQPTTAPACEEVCDSICSVNRSCSCLDSICTEVCPSCGHNSECLNLQCRCKLGYHATDGNETNCIDVNECSDHLTCETAGHICHNSQGSYQCICRDGFIPSQDGKSCIKSFCVCGENAGLYDNSTRDCSCFPGFSGDPTTECIDVDECNETIFPCSDAEICVNTIGSYYCECIPGYITSIDGCIPILCPPVDIPCNQLDSLISLCASAMHGVRSVTFRSTLAGYSVTSETKCSANTTNAYIPLGSRKCLLEGTWDTVTWLGSCGVGLKEVASQDIETEEQRVQVSASLQLLTSNSFHLTVDELFTASEAMTNVTNSTSSISVRTASSVISTISNVLRSPAQTYSNQTSRFLAQLDTVASLVELPTAEPIKAVSNNVAVIVTSGDTSAGDIALIMFVRPNTAVNGFRSDQFTISNMLSLSGTVVDGQRVQASITVSGEAIGDIPSKVSVNAIGNRKNQFPANINIRSSPIAEQTKTVTLTSLVLSATVNNRTVSNLPHESRVRYSLPATYDGEKQDPLCVFWNESTNSWSDEGCRLTEATVNSLTCSCDHFTNFAALLRPKPVEEDPQKPTPLDIVTIVGCSLSTFSLLILVMLFLCLRGTRAGRKFQGSFLLLNLSIALLGLNVALLISETPFFAYAEDYDAISSSCRTIAVFLHLFLLASCAWMNCEGVMLFLAVVKPFYTRAHVTNKSVVLFSIAWGWMMPAVFVGIAALANVGIYVYPHTDGFAVTCWINPDYIIYLAVVPIAVMIAGNVVIYIILSYHLCIKRDTEWSKSWRASRDSYQRKFGINVSILVMLGVTWIFGFSLPVIKDETAALVFAYVFTVSNTLQGLFLLLLYLMRNKQIISMFTSEISSLFSNMGLSSTASAVSRRTGQVDLSTSLEDSSPSSFNLRSAKNSYVSNIVADPRTVGMYSA